MGLDLALLALRDKREFDNDLIVLYNILNFHRNYKIFGQIENVEPSYEGSMPEEVETTIHTSPLPHDKKVYIYRDEGAEATSTNNYGERFRYTTAEEMSKLQLPENATPTDKAIMAYVRALNPDMPIIIEWS